MTPPKIVIYPRPTTPKERLIFALDVEHFEEAERLVTLLAPHVGMFKVGPRLITAVGAQVLEMINACGAGIFVDLKFHDIPETVAAAAHEIARHRTRLFTVHALGGREMIRRAVAELASMTLIPGVPFPQCLAVTVLTSHSQADIETLGFAVPIVEQAKRLAKLAMDSGAAGIVASGHELHGLKSVLPEDTIFVTPGIRGAADPVGDQARVMTAKDAIAAGATYVVVGRPIRDAKSPVDAAKRIVDEIASA